jgi:hypothetical protein
MNIVSISKWSACITIGLQKRYTEALISLPEVKQWLRAIQEQQILENGLYLSANLFLSDIVLSGQDEPHVNLNFINYPKFPADEAQMRAGVLEIASCLMEKMDQNRVVVAFDRELVMLEKDARINQKILNQIQ